MGCLKGPHKIKGLKCGVSAHLNITTVASVVFSLVVYKAINIKLKVELSRQKSQAHIF